MIVLMRFETEDEYFRFCNLSCAHGVYCKVLSIRVLDDGKVIVNMKFEGM